MPGSPRPDPKAVAGPAPYVENCATCHAAPTVARYAESQCHPPEDHGDFAQPVSDEKCGSCHQPEYQQTLASKHFATRVRRALDSDRAARASLRQDGFTAATAEARRFVGDSSAAESGGRLCAACHYDEHRLGLRPVQRADFCVGCHKGREDHFADPAARAETRCFTCHVREGTTVAGQVVNTHRFAVPGSTSAAR
jgi:hypothetical protein